MDSDSNNFNNKRSKQREWFTTKLLTHELLLATGTPLLPLPPAQRQGHTTASSASLARVAEVARRCSLCQEEAPRPPALARTWGSTGHVLPMPPPGYCTMNPIPVGTGKTTYTAFGNLWRGKRGRQIPLPSGLWWAHSHWWLCEFPFQYEAASDTEFDILEWIRWVHFLCSVNT